MRVRTKRMVPNRIRSKNQLKVHINSNDTDYVINSV